MGNGRHVHRLRLLKLCIKLSQILQEIVDLWRAMYTYFGLKFFQSSLQPYLVEVDLGEESNRQLCISPGMDMVLFAFGVTLLGFITYLEAWVIGNPLLPGVVFRVKFITPLILALLCLYGSLGIFLLCGVL